jgi:WD40 repeat protein
VALWNLKESRLDWLKNDQESPVTSVDVSFEFNDVLVYSNNDGKVVSSNNKGELYFIEQIIQGSVNSAILTLDGNYIIASGQDSIVHILNSKSGKPINHFYHRGTSSSNINKAFVDNKNKYYVTGHSDGIIKVWDLFSREFIYSKKFSEYGISSISIDKTSEILAVGDVGKKLFLYSIDYQYVLSQKKVHSLTTSIDFRSNYKNIITSHKDRFGYWDYNNNNELHLYDNKEDIHGDFVSKVMYYPDNDLDLIISSGQDGSIKIFDLNSYGLKAELVCDKDNGWIIIGENGLFNGEGSIINKYKNRAYTLDKNILKNLF